jgi:hypothetical protein
MNHTCEKIFIESKLIQEKATTCYKLLDKRDKGGVIHSINATLFDFHCLP